MFKIRSINYHYIVACVVLVFSTLAGIANGSDERIGSGSPLVTDPQELSQAGYSPDSTNVYGNPNDGYFQLYTGAHSEQSKNLFGPSSEIYHSIPPSAFVAADPPADSAGNLTPTITTKGRFLFCDSPALEEEFLASVQLPSGAKIIRFEYFGYDNTNTDNVAQLARVCQATNIADTEYTTLTPEIGSGEADTPGNFFVTTTIDETVNNRQCVYQAIVDLSGDSCRDQNMRAYKARVVWMRQISPSPVSATFNDVPTTHPFFQSIEAMASSGITGGCGGGDYCPNDPLTRGQMAAFLARALGLHWEGF